MEELLNKLIKKGWKPWGNKKEIGKFIVRKRGRSIERPQSQYMIYFYDKDDYCFMAYSLRELVSKESGLLQFICKNKIIETDDDYSREKYRYNHGMKKEYKSRVIKGEARKYQVDYEYRLIECALKDESELEEFLVENINIEGNGK